MAIYPDKKVGGALTGRFRVEVQLGHYRKRGRFDTLVAAKDAERQWRQELASGITESAAPVAPQVGIKYLSQLLAKSAPMLWNHTPHGELCVVKVNQIIEWLGDPQLADINTAWIDDVVTRLRAEGRAPGTVNRYLSALHAVLKWGSKRKHNELPDFSWQDEEEGRLRYLTPAEEVKLLATLRALGYDEIADFAAAAIDTGCRRSELLHAGVRQLEGRWLRLWKTKSGHARSVPLTERAQVILVDRLPWSFNEAQLRYAWAKAKVAMGLSQDEDFVVHSLRHTCATRLVERGVNLAVVQKFMGHQTIQTTLRYAHVSDDTLAAAASALSGGQTMSAGRTSNSNEGWGTDRGGPKVTHSVSTQRGVLEAVE